MNHVSALKLLAILGLWTNGHCHCFAKADAPGVYAPSVDSTAEFTTQVLLSDLADPVGVAVRPTQAKRGPYELFVAESGAARVVSVTTDALDEVREVVTGLPVSSADQNTARGPQGLLFLDRKKLIVGINGPEGSQLWGYALRGDNSRRSASDTDHTAGPLKASVAEQISNVRFAGLALADKTAFITTGGAESEGWVLKSSLEANRLTNLQPYLEVQKLAGQGGPAGIAIIPAPRPAFLVVALSGSRTTPNDSRLAYFVPSTGELVLDLATGLSDIISLAYSPSGQLYAADCSWHSDREGGIYRIDDARIEGRQACRAVKIASLRRPMCLAFAPDGSLYVTTSGESAEASEGVLVKISGRL